MKTKIFTVLAIAAFMVSVMAVGSAEADTAEISPVAAKAMVETSPDDTFIVDVRTLEEYYFVGTCALVGKGDPIAYNIPWKLWTSRIDCAEHEPLYRTVECLFGFFIRRTFDPTDTIILMCRSGSRSTTAAEYLDGLGYFETTIYDMVKGFQGSANDDGYRCGMKSGDDCWQGADADPLTPELEHLPMTQKLDCDKIWLYMWKPCCKHKCKPCCKPCCKH